MLVYEHDLSPDSVWLLVKSNQIPWETIPRNSIPYVQELGNFYAKSEFFTQREHLSSYLMKYTLSGHGELEYNDTKYRVGPGDCFWIDCQNYQRYTTAPGDREWHVIWIHFYGEPCRQYYNLFCEHNQSPVVHLPDGNGMEHALLDLLEKYNQVVQDPLLDLRASGILTDMMISCTLASAHIDASVIPECIRSAQDYLSRHYSENITLDELSQTYSLNKFYFIRLFKRYTGCTPHEYLINARLHQAKTLLRSSALSVAEIAISVGFDHVGHFIDLFKRSEGTTPGAFRKSWL